MHSVGRGIRVAGWIVVALAVGFFVATLIGDVPYGIAVLVLLGVAGLAMVDVGKFLIRRSDGPLPPEPRTLDAWRANHDDETR